MDTDDFIGLVIVIALTAAILGFGYFSAKESCSARWESSGHEIEWSLFGGCRVHVDGRILPEDVIRDMDALKAEVE